MLKGCTKLVTDQIKKFDHSVIASLNIDDIALGMRVLSPASELLKPTKLDIYDDQFENLDWKFKVS